MKLMQVRLQSPPKSADKLSVLHLPEFKFIQNGVFNIATVLHLPEFKFIQNAATTCAPNNPIHAETCTLARLQERTSWN
jgi:hypothetical protein